MKTKFLLLSMSISMGLSSIAQIIPSANPDYPIWSTPVNTGLAICPEYDIQAAVFDDGSGTYQIFWIDETNGNILDIDGNQGSDPDVAYYGDETALAVVYQNGGKIFLDEFYLGSMSPVDYYINSSTFIAGGTYPNLDMNSSGKGIISWEDNGDIYACSYELFPFNIGPAVLIANGGTQPDAIALDYNDFAAITYINSNTGEIVIEVIDYLALMAGGYGQVNQWITQPVTFYEYPRIASQRNSLFTSIKDFAVVAQDLNYYGSSVQGFFISGMSSLVGPTLINNGLDGCDLYDPRPVVAFDRDKIDIAWSQFYGPSCYPHSNGILNYDVLLAEFNILGQNVNGATVYHEVNNNQSTFSYPDNSRTSISTEYDGLTGNVILDDYYHEGVLFNDQNTLFWKPRSMVLPFFINEPGSGTLSANETFSLLNSPVNETIEVLSSNDAEATFVLYDNAGRLLDVDQTSNGNNTYSLDISHLSGGTYFLKCSSSAGDEVLRVLQVR